MNRRVITLLNAALLALFVSLSASTAFAGLIPVSGPWFAVITQNAPDLAQNPSLPLNRVDMQVSGDNPIDFNSDVGGDGLARYTLATFLGVPADAFECYCSGLGGPLQPGQDPTAWLNDTFIRFFGLVDLHQGVNYLAVAHDDGVQFDIFGIGTVLQTTLSTPNENTFDLVAINAPTAGQYDFRLSYGECCGPPARLGLFYLPEPGSVALLAAVLGVIGLTAHRRHRV